MIVVVAGMQRSGSTFSFNVVKKLLESRGRVAHFVGDNLAEVIRYRSISDHIIVKTHVPCPEMSRAIVKGEIRCICTVRRPEDAVLSWSNAFGFSLEESVPIIASWLAWHKSVSPHTINVKFELIEKWPLLSVYQIGSPLVGGIKLGEAVAISRSFEKSKVRDLVKSIDRNSSAVTDIGFSYYDSKTLFHRNHISSKNLSIARQKLGSNELYALREQLAPYVDKTGKYRWE